MVTSGGTSIAGGTTIGGMVTSGGTVTTGRTVTTGGTVTTRLKRAFLKWVPLSLSTISKIIFPHVQIL